MTNSQTRIPYDDLRATLERALLKLTLTAPRAALAASLFAETTRDGVYTHGLNRFERFAQMIENGNVSPNAEPSHVSGFGAIAQWDGNRGPGNLNAHAAMQHAVTLAQTHGLGAVALRDTNHWMRGGTYGWQAADAGCFGLCFTNTLAMVPPWGAKTPALGNNPLILAVPRLSGAHIVLDFALSQYSVGQTYAHARRGEQFEVDAGYDSAGNLTRDPQAILESSRYLPVGFWKGSGLALLLDLFAAMLSDGSASHQIPQDALRESGISQFFLAIDPRTYTNPSELDQIAAGILTAFHAAEPIDAALPVRHPGEQTLKLREENLRLGVPVDDPAWQALLRRS